MKVAAAARRMPPLVAVVVGLLLLGGCGAATSDGARPVDSDIADLLRPQATPSSSSTESLSQQQVSVAWVTGRKLETSERLVSADTRQQQLDGALLALVDGPDTSEGARGLTTLLPPDVVVVGELRGARAVVDVALTTPLEPRSLPLAVGQLAVTALSVSGVRSVAFTVDGLPAEVPLPRTGELVRVVTERDYQPVLG